MQEDKKYHIKSVSLDFEEASFLEDYELSPTRLIKEKIWEMKGIFKQVAQRKMERQERAITLYLKQIAELEAEIKKLKDVLDKKEGRAEADSIEFGRIPKAEH